MCELFGLSSKHAPAASDLPLPEFRQRGGASANNPDGWGIVCTPAATGIYQDGVLLRQLSTHTDQPQ